MEDLSARLGALLNDPQTMAQLQAMASALGLGQGQSPTSFNNTQNPPQNQPLGPGGGLDLSRLASLLGGSPPAASAPSPAPSPAPASPGGGLGALGLLGGLLGGGGRPAGRQEDKNVQLLRALKPHMSAARQSRVDEAIRLCQLLALLPALRESGLLGNLLGGDRP